MSKIIQNAIRIKEHDIIMFSNSSTDYQEYEGYSIQGGLDYVMFNLPQGKTNDDIELLTIMDDDSMDKIMTKLIWGTYGKSFEKKLRMVKLFDCESDHLLKIMEQKNKPKIYDPTIKHILEYRRLQERKEKIQKIKQVMNDK